MAFLEGIRRIHDMWGTGKAWTRLAIICQTLWFTAVVYLATIPSEPALAAMLVILIGSIVVFAFAAPHIVALGIAIETVQTTMAKIIAIEFSIWLICRIVPIANKPELVWVILGIFGAFSFFLFSTNKLPVEWEYWVPRFLWTLVVLFAGVVIVMTFEVTTEPINATIGPIKIGNGGSAQSSVAPATNNSAPATKSTIQVVGRCGGSGEYSTPFTPGVRIIKFNAPADCWGEWMAIPAGTYQVTVSAPVWVNMAEATMPAPTKAESRQVRNGEELVFAKAMQVQLRSGNLNAGVEVTLKMK